MAFETGNKAAVGADHSKRRVMTQALISELNEIDPKENVTRMRKVIRQLITNAEGGDNTAIIAIFDRLDGKPVQAIANDDDGQPFIVKIIRPGAAGNAE